MKIGGINSKYLLNSIITSDFYFDFMIIQLIASSLILIYVAFKPMENINNEVITSIEILLSFLYFIDLIIRRTA